MVYEVRRTITEDLDTGEFKFTGSEISMREDVGADPAGTAAQTMNDHVADADPHTQYVQKVTGKALSTNDYTDAEKSKLAGVEPGATQNATNAQLRDRSTHTGTQPLSTISDAGTAAAANTGTGASDVPTTSQADGRYARLSGLNNFDTMPTVGGNPIVESGSNSDGEWTRWADGKQWSIAQVHLQGTGIRGLFWVFPMLFSSNSVYALCTASTASPDLYWASRENATSTGVNIWLNADGYVDVFAAGRYK